MVAPALLTAGASIIGDLVDRLLPDSAERAKVKLEYEAKMLDAIAQANIAQTEVNKVEAQSSNLFIAGWRPACGWVGVIGLAYHAILQPLLSFTMVAYGEPVVLPEFDTSVLMVVLTGMLGIGTMRSFDKYHETDTKTVLPWLKRNKDK
jgi:hypothetical protein